MKKKFTILITAAFMLLTMMVTTGTALADNASYVFNTDAGIAALGISKPDPGAGTPLSTTTPYVVNQISMSVTHGSTNTRVWNSSGTLDLRIYKSGGSLTFAAATGYKITEITITGSATNVFSVSGGSYSNGSWSNSTTGATSVTFTATGTGKINTITVAYESIGGSSTPSIIASDINLTYDATGGSIEYTLNNATGNVEAEVTTGSDWLTLGTVTESAVPFTCSANEGVAARTATVTLSYTGANDKIVTITQAAAPVIYTTIPDIFNAATITEASVNVTFNNWVVSGVSTNGKNVYVTDGTNGLIIFYTSDMSGTFSAGNILSGENVSCTLKLYNGAAELLNVNAADLMITDGGTVTLADIEMADLAGVNTGALLHYDGLTCTVNNNKYYLTDGTTSLQLYNALFAFSNPVAGKVYNITGVYVQYNSTKEIMPRSADDIEAVETEVADPVFSPEAGTYAEAQTVTMSCTTEGAAIHYTTDGTEPDGNSDVYTTGISVSETTTFKAKAIKDNNASTVVTTTYHICSADTPYTVAQALAFHEYPTSTIWVHGIVSTAPTAAPNNGQLTYYISDNGEATNQLQVYKGKGLNNAAFTAQDDIQVGDIVTITGVVKIYNNTTEFDAGNYLTSFERPVEPSITVANATVNVDAEGGEGTLTVTYENITTVAADVWFCNAEGTEDATYDWITASINNSTNNAEYLVEPNDGEARTAYFKVWAYDDETNEVYSNLVTINQAEYVAPTPSIAVDPNLVEAPAAGTDGTIAVTLTAIANDNIEVEWFESDGTTAATYNHDWIEAIVDSNNDINYMIEENTGEARSAYFKVYGLDADANDVYSELVTINQAAPVVDYATLPFEYDGNGTGTLPTGFTVDGLGTYSSSPKMQFNSTGDWAILKINERPGVLTFDIKGNSFNGSTFKVQTSTDGATYTDLETYTTLGATQSEEFANLAADVRYIKWIYTQKVNGNVALGNIVLEAYDYTPAITLTQYTYNLNAEGGDAVLPVTTANLAATPNLEVVFYESDGVTTATYDWITANINNEGNIAGHINANTGDARSAYFKVSGLAADNSTTVYSNLVTINQAAYVLSIEFETTSLDIVAGGEDRTLSFDYEGLGQDPTFSINFYESDGTTAATYDWIDAEITQDDKVNITVAANTGAARSAYFKVYGANGTVNTESNLVTINQAAAGQTASYTLITSVDDLTPGYHYLIASAMTVNNDLDDVVIIMAGQNSNNRGVKTVLIDEATATVTLSSSDDYYDFVISGYTGNWTIYDESYNQGNGGYLYASSNSANQLKTRAANSDKNSEWSITIDNEGVATIVAQGANGRNTMQYNSGSSIFSCYSSASQADVYLYKKTTDTPVYYSPTAMTLENPNPAVDPIIVLNNEILTITGNITCSPDDILIQDGGQLIHDNPINATIQRNIKGYNANRDADNSGYMLIASPVADPLNVNEQVAIISGDYDLYIFDESQPEKEWRNYETNPKPFTTFVNGVGYLYANAANQTISFAGELKPSNEPVNIDLNYTDGNLFAGWNLVGNPFACNAYLADTVGMGKAFYRMNTAGNGFVAVTSGTIAPMEGIFVKASAANQSFKFTRTAPAANPGKGDLNIQVAQVVNSRDAQPISDNAIIRFDGGSALEKFSFRDDNAKIYFTQGNKDYAVVSATAHGEMPVNFKAAKNGTYTISVEAENLDVNYLHLIDNKTGMDIDLLQTPSYTFEANMSDYASRFRLVFNANSVNDIDYANNNFGFISNGNLMILGIEGEATLQVIDVTGRILSTETFYGSYDKAVNAKAGVYMLRLIQGENVRTQKIVVR